MKQLNNEFLSLAAMLSFFVPLILVIIRKLWKDPFFMSFAIYWAISGCLSVIDFIPGIKRETLQLAGALGNMFDLPMILAILYYTSRSQQIKKFAAFAFICCVVLEISGVVIKGINYEALKYPLGTGVAFVLIILFWEIIRYMRMEEPNNRQNAKVLVYAAVLFEYLCYIVVYVVDYFASEDFYNARKTDIYTIYYVSTVIGILIASCGYLVYKKYTRKEVLVNQVKIDII